MKQAMFMQTSPGEDIRTVTVDINKLVSVIEQPGFSEGVAVTSQGSEEAPGSDVESVAQVFGALILDASTAERSNTELNMSPVWSRVVKEGRRLKHVTGNVIVHPKPRLNPPREKRTGGIVGTSTGGNIQVVMTNLESGFATKFSSDLHSETLAKYLKEKLCKRKPDKRQTMLTVASAPSK